MSRGAEMKKPAVKKTTRTPAKKAASKPVAKPAAKPATKSAAKPAVKPAAKPAPKPAAKPAPKPAAKPAPKPAAKPAVTPAVKTAAKQVVKAVAKEAPEKSSDGGLTEAQLRKAPAKDYMNAEQLAYFRKMLLAMQREIHEKADETSEHLREHEIEPDPTDQATIEEEYALELRARDRERKLLKKIGEALRRIDDGTYGWCEETGEAIGIPRMLARPTATLSVEAQTRRELKQKLYGD